MSMNDKERYMTAAHAMQSGVAMEMELGGGETDPKHLRVGINAAMSDQAGLVRLLIARGFITEREYVAAIADKMQEEADSYAKKLSDQLGTRITLV